MSSGDVAVLNSKLDTLIEDFKGFKQYTLGFLMAIVIPFAVYVVLELTNSKTDIALVKQQVELSSKAIKEE